MVEEYGVRCTGDGDVQIGVLEDDVRGLASKFQGHMLQVLRGGLDDELADLSRSREGDLVDSRMPCQRGACRFAEARDDVYHAIGKTRLLHNFAEAQRREGRFLRHLEHYGTTRGKRRGQLPGSHEQREVPGDNLSHDTDWLRSCVRVVLDARRVEDR